MKLFRISTYLSLAFLFAWNNAAMAADTAVVVQNGGPSVIVSPSQTGDSTNPYLLGLIGSSPTSLSVILDAPVPTTFSDFASFSVFSGSRINITATPVSSGVFNSFAVNLYSGLINPAGPPSSGSLLATITNSTTLAGMANLDLNSGSYYFKIDGVANSIGNFQPSYAVELFASPVPEPGIFAMMLCGLGLVSFVAPRRRQV